MQNPKLRILNFTSKKELRKYIHPVLKLMNESFTEIYGYSQLDENEMLDLANHFIPFLDPKFVAVVTYEDEVAGFMITIASINEGIIAARGHIFPLGFLKILKASKNASQLDLLIGGIKAKYRGLGIDVLIAVHIISVAKKSGFKSIDSHLELESNWKMRAEMKNWAAQYIRITGSFKRALIIAMMQPNRLITRQSGKTTVRLREINA